MSNLDTNTNVSEVNLLLEYDQWHAPSLKEILDSMESNEGRITMSTCLQREGMRNQMGRIYPYTVLKKQFEEYGEFVSERSAVGEIDHPELLTVTMDRGAILITKQWWEYNAKLGKNEWWGDFEILTTAKGPVVAGYVKDKVKFGISSRGLGSLEEDHKLKANIVQDDFVIVCWDIVLHPSTHFAIPKVKIPVSTQLHEYNHNIYNRYMNNKMNMLLEKSQLARKNGNIIL